MTLKNKIIFVFLSIITLGIYPCFLCKCKNYKLNNKLSTSKKINVNIVKLRSLLGGKTNILGAEYTHTKVKIFIKNSEKVHIEEIKKMKGISGVIISSDAVKIIVGNSAKLIAKQI